MAQFVARSGGAPAHCARRHRVGAASGAASTTREFGPLLRLPGPARLWGAPAPPRPAGARRHRAGLRRFSWARVAQPVRPRGAAADGTAALWRGGRGRCGRGRVSPAGRQGALRAAGAGGAEGIPASPHPVPVPARRALTEEAPAVPRPGVPRRDRVLPALGSAPRRCGASAVGPARPCRPSAPGAAPPRLPAAGVPGRLPAKIRRGSSQRAAVCLWLIVSCSEAVGRLKLVWVVD